MWQYTSDNASEFRSAEFVATVERLGAEHRRIRAGRPQTNGCVERVQLTILDECWKPAFARELPPLQPVTAIWVLPSDEVAVDACREVAQRK